MLKISSLIPRPSERKKISLDTSTSKVILVKDDPFTRGTNNGDRDFAIREYQEFNNKKFLWLTEQPERALDYLRDEQLVDTRLRALTKKPIDVVSVPFPFLWVGATITNEAQFTVRGSYASEIPSPVRVLFLKRLKRFPQTLATWLAEQRTINWVLYEGRRFGRSDLGWSIAEHCERIGIPFYALRMSALTTWTRPQDTQEKFDSWDATTWPERLPQQYPISAFE